MSKALYAYVHCTICNNGVTLTEYVYTIHVRVYECYPGGYGGYKVGGGRG